MIRHYRIESSKLVECAEVGTVAIYAAPTESELKELREVHGLAPHTIQSALDADEIGRFDVEDDHLAIILKRPCNYTAKDDFFFRVMSAGVFLFKEKLVVVLASDIAIFEGKLARVASLQEVLLRIINVTINHFMGHLKVINMLSEGLEHKISTSMENQHLLKMFTLEKSLVYFLSALNDNSAMMSKLKANAAKLGFSVEQVQLLDDIIIDAAQCLTLTQTYSNILSGLMDARASLVNNNLNVMMRNLNAVVIAVAVPSFFAGVGGMSEFSAVVGLTHWYIAYPVFLAVMAAMGAGTYVLIKRMGS